MKILTRLLFLSSALLLVSSHLLAQTTKQNPIRKAGKYAVELRIPAEGIFAEEAIDVEFRLTDTSNNDPVLGAAGVIRAKSLAAITMPSMPGMPKQVPKIHTEGVPGDYGIECFFPHGGEYQIDLSITPPNEAKPFTVTFTVSVQDAEGLKRRKPRPKPYYVEFATKPDAKAGEVTTLHFAIRDTKTKALVKDFDEAHTKVFHLIVVSKDLAWFLHEHPTQQEDGTFKQEITFPFGGAFRAFADVAPKNAGSQVLSTSLNVGGANANGTSTLKETPKTQVVDGVQAVFKLNENPVPTGKTTTVTFILKENGTGKPITDLEPYLGAYGHLMIIHQDGQTFVHSHPMEDEAGVALSRSGTVAFNARFPKPGIYKAWGQFQRGGKVLTIPFVLEVKGGAR
jgi:hypothetical protein